MKSLITEPQVSRDRREKVLRILLVSTSDVGGGAEISAWNLFNTYRARGYESQLAVGMRRTNDPNVVLIPKDSSRNAWARFWIRLSNKLGRVGGQARGIHRSRTLCDWIGEPGRTLGRALGREDLDFPGTWKLLELGTPVDIIHCFNLHDEYFDLRVLPRLSQARPVILDLRDAWLLSGHCAHSFDCDRWKIGCGKCPDLNIYPAISRDGTAFNWKRKQEIFSKSRLYVATPSQWLMDKATQSMLAPAIIESRVIPTGVDLSVFHPAEKSSVRARLNIPQDAKVLLFAANGIRRNMWKDYRTMTSAVRLLSERLRGHAVLFIALGEKGPDERIGEAQIRFVPHLKDPKDVAGYYQAADLYVHAAAADTFPRTVLEALASGTPVVATGVGGIPEQIRSLENSTGGARATGIVVPPGDAQAMASAIEKLLIDDDLSRTLSENAARDACERFDVVQQANRYVEWYQELLERDPRGVASRSDSLQ